MKRTRMIACAMGLVMALTLLVAGAAFADTGSVVLTGAGDIVWTNDAAFGFEGKTLDGNALNSTDDAGVNCVWALEDGTGTGAGWRLTIASGDLTGLTDSLSQPVTYTLASGITPAYNQFGLRIQVEQADVTIQSGAEGSMPVSGLTYGVSTAADVTTDLEILEAAVDEGMGAYDIDPLFTIYLPGDVYAGTGQVVLTITQTDAPA